MTPINYKSPIARFLFAQTTSLLGSSIVQYAIIWHITLTTSSGSMLALSTLCGFVPQILISLFAGGWIDRFNRKQIILLSDSVIALTTLLLAILIYLGITSPLYLFVVLIIRSAGTGIQMPAVNAIIPQLVSPDKLMKINGINSALSSFILFLSPVISGAILAVSSFETTLLIDVLTAAIGVTLTAFIAIPTLPAHTGDKPSGVSDLKLGLSFLKQNTTMKHLLPYQMIILFLISPSAFLTPLMVSRSFGEEIWRLTFSEMTYSLGMILGGIVITTWGGFDKKMHTTLLAGTLYGALMVGLGAAPWFLLYLIFNTLIGITSPCYNTPITVTIQEQVPAHMHGRMFSLMQIVGSCALPLGMTLFGPLADVINVRYILIISGIITLLYSAYVRHTGRFAQ